MYINKKKHILTRTMMLIAVLNLVALLVNAGIRFALDENTSFSPSMLNAMIFNLQIAVSAMLILARAIAFIVANRKVKRIKGLIAEDDMDEMSQLQREIIPNSLSTLSLDAIDKLIKVWAVILVGVQIAYEITTVAYKGFIENLILGVNVTDPNEYMAFTSLYNSTHGFKYIGMLIAIVIGIYVTGIFLKDRFLVISAIVLMMIFLGAFLLMNTSTLTIASREIKVVWTSVIFHALQTFGLFVLAVYMNIRYKGM